MSEPFLILHRVRGEPAFDIATRMRCAICYGVGGHNVPDFETGEVTDYEGYSCDECEGQGFWWIIPTSGHRAYPYWNCDLYEWVSNSDGMPYAPMPDGWPDHYPLKAEPPKLSISGLLSKIIPLTISKDRR